MLTSSSRMHSASPGATHDVSVRRIRVKTLDEMLALRLISSEQHQDIHAWIASARTPEAILEMPAPLWRAFALASVLMNVDADLQQPPRFEFDQ